MSSSYCCILEHFETRQRKEVKEVKQQGGKLMIMEEAFHSRYDILRDSTSSEMQEKEFQKKS